MFSFGRVFVVAAALLFLIDTTKCTPVDCIESDCTESSVENVEPQINNINCTFEPSTCGWVQDKRDDFDWTLTEGSTGSSLTGPLFDHTSGEGQYLFIETSSPRRKNQKAVLNYEFSTSVNEGCFSMYYHMYGRDVGTLMLSTTSSKGTVNSLWDESWTQGDKWWRVSVSIPEDTSMISITGLVGDGFRGDIAIDDITFSSAACVKAAPTEDPAFKVPVG